MALLIQSGSAAGKTTLMDAVLSFMPEEDQIRYSAMTGQSLYYMGQQKLKHKILAIAEEEGVSQASYALKLLQSDGKLTIAAAGKNKNNGRQSTESYTVEGPVMMFLTTTSEYPDPELQNRCLTIRVNESSDQTASIHDRQRTRYLSTSSQSKIEDIRKLHRNAQRLLESLPVVMPWARQLTFRTNLRGQDSLFCFRRAGKLVGCRVHLEPTKQVVFIMPLTAETLVEQYSASLKTTRRLRESSVKDLNAMTSSCSVTS